MRQAELPAGKEGRHHRGNEMANQASGLSAQRKKLFLPLFPDES